MLFPIIFVRLQPVVGFSWTVRVLGLIQLLSSLVALLLLFAGAPKPAPKAPRSLIHWHAFKEIPFSAYCVANLIIFMAYFIPLIYVPFYAIDVLDTSTEMAFDLLAVLNAASLIGRLSSSILASKIGVTRLLPISVVSLALLLFGWREVSDLGGFAVFCILFGIFSGTLIAANPVVVAHPVISPSASVIGTRLGMQWFTSSLGVLVGAPIAGVLGADGSADAFQRLQAFSGAIMVGGFLFLLVPLVAIWQHNRNCNSKS